jgi:hypothetical protein
MNGRLDVYEGRACWLFLGDDKKGDLAQNHRCRLQAARPADRVVTAWVTT